MSQKMLSISFVMVMLIVLAALALPACSTGTGQPSSSPAAQPSSSSATSSTTGQPTSSGTHQNGKSGGQPTAHQGGGQDMSKVLSRAAEILGVSSDTFTSAWETAQKSVFGERPAGGTANAGQTASANTGTSGQPPQPPSEGTGNHGQPSSGGQFQGQSEMMQKVYSKMAEILNISADKISAAMEQAFKEMGASQSSSN